MYRNEVLVSQENAVFKIKVKGGSIDIFRSQRKSMERGDMQCNGRLTASHLASSISHAKPNPAAIEFL